MNKSSNKSLIGAGLLAAIASSLCCIVPTIAAVASISGIAATFSWLEPARPFLIGFTIVVLGFAWYQHLKNKKDEIDCDCEEDEKPSFLQSKKFLGIITVFAGLMLAFPYYSAMFFPQSENSGIVVSKENIAEAKLQIEGMTCSSCEHHVTKSLTDQEAVIEATSSYKKGLAIVKFDKSRTTVEELSEIVETQTGYTVINQETIN